jgi:hypothetical protein
MGFTVEALDYLHKGLPKVPGARRQQSPDNSPSGEYDVCQYACLCSHSYEEK